MKETITNNREHKVYSVVRTVRTPDGIYPRILGVFSTREGAETFRKYETDACRTDIYESTFTINGGKITITENKFNDELQVWIRDYLWTFVTKEELAEDEDLVYLQVGNFLDRITFGIAYDYNILGTEMFIHYEPNLEFSVIYNGKVEHCLISWWEIPFTKAIEEMIPRLRDRITSEIHRLLWGLPF